MSAMTSNSVCNGKLPPRDGNIRRSAEFQGHLIHRNARPTRAAEPPHVSAVLFIQLSSQGERMKLHLL